MVNRILGVVSIALLLMTGCAQRHKPDHTTIVPAPVTVASRTFLFSYSATITGLEPRQTVRAWLPVAASDADQQVHIVSMNVPDHAKFTSEPKFGNRMLYVEVESAQTGTIPLSITYYVTRKELRSEWTGDDPSTDVDQFLLPDAKVPVGGKPLMLLQDKALSANQSECARALYDLVDSHMVYRKDIPGWGQGDAEWACDSRGGNCSDFHSLFISLARSQDIPAKFEIGFPLPPARGEGEVSGYHCWAKYKPQDSGWIPVDISEADKHPLMKDYYFGNLTSDRMRFSTGRDLTLSPAQQGPPLNFFIYPYVEVNGAPLAAENVQMKFSFQDVAPAK